MPINLKSIIEDDMAVRSGGFSGAVFLTYTLNLAFFEQIVAPALERAGCSNVLIIVDPDGYAEALEMGQKNVSFAGIRYVCTPLLRKGYGVQHAKMLLMAGPERGRLIIGSGNLTLHGYSQNLEVFCHFEYDRKNPDHEAQIAFHSAWQLLRGISEDPSFSSTALRQMDVISEKAGWLKSDPLAVDNFFVWNNSETSLWSQFNNWRNQFLNGAPLKELRVFSPYFDQDADMLRQFTENLLPDRVDLYSSNENTTLDAKCLVKNWPQDFPLPLLYNIKEIREDQSQRILHAKVVVGIEEEGSWCIAGSANMTRAAFSKSWLHGSNLEMVALRWFPDKAAFDYLLDKPVSIIPLNLETFQPSGVSNFSEQPQKVFSNSIQITELTLQNKYLTGRVNHWPESITKDIELVFLRSGVCITGKLNQDLNFRLPCPYDIQSSEAVFIQGGGCKTFPRWIDIPEALHEYGTRSYHERIQAKLDTVSGSESLFHELMEALFDRITPLQSTESNYGRVVPPSTKKGDSDKPDDDTPAPDVERFVVPEKDASGNFLIGRYTRIPYDHNIHSLRDLLSIVLLNLTRPPDISTEKRLEEERSAEQDTVVDQDVEQNKINARKRLCNYLIDYSKRYSRRLCQPEFIENISPTILLENHLTLSRILLEFETRVDEFKLEDFTKCYWLLWAPLFWPSIVGIEGKSCWQLFTERDLSKEFIEVWKRLSLTSHFIIMTSKAFGHPPSWSLGLYSPHLVSNFIVLNKLIASFTKYLGVNLHYCELPSNLGSYYFNWEESISNFDQISVYLPPARERLSPIFDWIDNQNDLAMCQGIIERIRQEELMDEFTSYQNYPNEIRGLITEPDDEGLVYCPKCGGALRLNTVTEINRGKLVLCNMNNDVWLYKDEKLSTRVL